MDGKNIVPDLCSLILHCACHQCADERRAVVVFEIDTTQADDA